MTYKRDKEVYDLAVANKEVDLFDHYYDKYRKAFFKQAGGMANPKTWNYMRDSKGRKHG